MNHTRAAFLLPAAALPLAVSLALSACAPSASAAPPTDAPAAGSTSEVNDSDRDRIARYETLIAQLQEQLLQEKVDRYLSDAIALERGARERGAQACADEPECALTLAAEDEPSESAPRPVSADTQPTDLSVEAAAEAAAPAASLDFSVSGGQITVTRCTLTHGASGCVTVPARVGGLPVTHIAEGAFRDTDVTSVMLPDTVTEIGWFAFSGCARLCSVTLPASVSDIGYGAFDGCPLLTVTVRPGSYAEQWARSYGIPTA